MENENIRSFEDEYFGGQKYKFMSDVRKLKNIGVLHYLILELE